MEPPKTEVVPIPHSPDFKLRYVAVAKVVECRILNKHWFVHFEGSRESIALAAESEPQPFKIGDRVRITFERIADAQPI